MEEPLVKEVAEAGDLAAGNLVRPVMKTALLVQPILVVAVGLQEALIQILGEVEALA
jgi:hypothetical protein